MILVLALPLAAYGVYLLGMAFANRPVSAWNFLVLGLLSATVAILAGHHGSGLLALGGCVLAGLCFCVFAYYFSEKEI